MGFRVTAKEVESVWIPEDDRANALCFPSQVGCALGMYFSAQLVTKASNRKPESLRNYRTSLATVNKLLGSFGETGVKSRHECGS